MEEDRMGMRVESDVAEITKDAKGLVGISIGGGHPNCPCVYVVQIFDGSPADEDERIRSGDEIVAVNGVSVKGERKTTVAQLIQMSTNPVKITFNKLEADPQRGKTFDILLKKAKHKVVEFMDADSADALGLSRAILCNDPLLTRLEVLEGHATFYKDFIAAFKDFVQHHGKLNESTKIFGDIFCELAVHEAQTNACEAFSEFGAAHRLLDKRQGEMLKQLTPIISDLATYCDKAIPDTRLTVKKYLDVKYEYLSYCLKLKELDDEEVEFHQMNENLYRVETGNYEYRLMLRCRQESRLRFQKMRSDVMVKIELLDQKHVRDIITHMSNIVKTMATCEEECVTFLEKLEFNPFEIDIGQIGVKYNTTGRMDSGDLGDGDEAALKEPANGKPTASNISPQESNDDPLISTEELFPMVQRNLDLIDIS